MKQQNKFRCITVFVCLLFNFWATSQNIPKKEISQYVWDLSYIFPSDKAWDTELKNVQAKIKTIANIKPTMGKSAKEFAEGMDSIYDLRSRAAILAAYGAMRSDVNTKDDAASAMAAVGQNLETEVESAISFLDYEVIKIGKNKLTQWMISEPALQKHKRRINRILLEAPYSSSPEVESVIKSMRGWPSVSADGYFAFFESDLKWPVYKNAEGKETEVTNSNYRSARRSNNAQERIAVQNAFLNFLGSYKSILGFLYTKRIEADLTIARHKKFDDGIDALWYLRDGVPVGSYKIMINTAQKNKPVLQRYSIVLAKLLGLEKVAYQDFFSLPKAYSKTYPIEEAFELIFEALKPLGTEYIEKVKIEIARPTMHLLPMSEKRTFYSNQMPLAGIPPYTMLTYNGAYLELLNLMGAVMSKVRYANIPLAACPDTRDDPPIYGNGLLYVSEMMMTDYLVSHAASKDEKIFYLHQALYRLWQLGFREAANAELDLAVQKMVIGNEPPGGQKISETYLQLLKNSYGDTEVDPLFANEWMNNNVQFYGYDGQFWIGAMASACLIYKQMKEGRTEAKKIVTEGLLGKTETDLSYGMLKSAGIDLAKEKTYQAMYNRMNYLLDEIEKLLK